MNAPVTFKGPGGYSADALGQNATGGTIQAEVPVGSTVLQAFLYGVTNGVFANSTDPAHPTITIHFDGTEVTLSNLNSCHSFLGAYRGDVTAAGSPKIGHGRGITRFALH